MSSKKFIVGAMVLFGALAATAVQARTDVQWSVTVGTPVGVPVYGHPYPVHARPVPVIVQQPIGHGYYRPVTYWDRDGDGIPNRFDRVFNPHWDRDGDGVPNRYDRHDDHYRHVGGHDRDRDGIPNWQDRHDDRYGYGARYGDRRDYRGPR